MRIEDLFLNQEKISQFIYLERYVNEGSRTYSKLAERFEGNRKYHPVEGVKSFKVPCLEIPKEKVSIFLDDPNAALISRYVRHSSILMPVHPEIFRDKKVPFIEEMQNYYFSTIVVQPVASTRTVMTLSKPHFIKLHYPRHISRFIRQMPRDVVEKCIKVSKELSSIKIENFGFLPETIGVAYSDGPQSWGFLIREFVPRPIVDNKPFLIPMFALYSKDLNNLSDLPLLVQLINFHKADPVELTFSQIMEPIINIWCTCARQTGFLFEMHGENTLLELNTKYLPSRIIYRDFDINIDMEVRKKLSLHTDFPMRKKNKNELEKIYSLLYDGFIGHHLFNYIVGTIEKYYDIKPKTFHDACRRSFANYFPDAAQHFSDKIYYYAKEARADGKYDLVATGQELEWR